MGLFGSRRDIFRSTPPLAISKYSPPGVVVRNGLTVCRDFKPKRVAYASSGTLLNIDSKISKECFFLAVSVYILSLIFSVLSELTLSGHNRTNKWMDS